MFNKALNMPARMHAQLSIRISMKRILLLNIKWSHKCHEQHTHTHTLNGDTQKLNWEYSLDITWICEIFPVHSTVKTHTCILISFLLFSLALSLIIFCTLYLFIYLSFYRWMCRAEIMQWPEFNFKYHFNAHSIVNVH